MQVPTDPTVAREASPPAVPGAGVGDHPPTLDLGDLARTVLPRAWIPVVAALLGGGLAWAWVSQRPPVYEARATVRVEQDAGQTAPVDALRDEDLRPIEMLKTIEEGITSHRLVARVVKVNALRDDPTFVPAGWRASGERGGGSAEEWLAENVRATLRRGTRLIDVVVRDRDAGRARRLADSFVHEAIASAEESRRAAAERARVSLQAELAALAGEVVSAERALQAFREAHRAVPFGKDENVVEDGMRDLNTELGRVRAERIRLEADLSRVERLADPSPATLLAIGSVAELPEIVELRRAIDVRTAEFARIRERYLERHPLHVEAASELAELRGALERALRQAADRLEARMAAAVAAEERMAAALDAQKEAALGRDALIIEHDALVRRRDAARELHASVLKRIGEAALAAEVADPGDLTVFDPAVEPSRPAGPGRPVVAAAGGVLGGMAGTGLLGMSLLGNRRLRHRSEVERLCGIAVLTAVPRVRRARRATPPVADAPPGRADADLAESFRGLRAALGSAGAGRSARTFVITSPGDGEGKSFCAVHFAASLARQGHRTLLIDADLRRPVLDDLLLPSGRSDNGLANYLAGQPGRGPACRITRVPGLHLLSAGRADGNPGELLIPEAFERILADAAQRFDRVVIDTAPVLGLADALVPAAAADSVCLVIRSGRTMRDDAREAVRRLARSGARPAGLVLNAVRGRATPDYGYRPPSPRAGAPAAAPAPAGRLVLEPS